MERKIFIGTSGWMYKHWGKRFYPADLKKDFLPFYSQEFKTVEINSSFYRMPRKSSFESWKKSTPRNFVFALKLNRYLTHRKRLILDEESKSFLIEFLSRSQGLEKKLAVILIQLPPSFKANIERLKRFLDSYSEALKELKFRPLSAIEFRHDSWLNDDVFKILKKYKVSLVLAGTPQIGSGIVTAGFSYIRMHGDAQHKSNYQNKELTELSKKINKFPSKIKKVFIYFNNDYSAYAIDNARFLIKKLEK